MHRTIRNRRTIMTNLAATATVLALVMGCSNGDDGAAGEDAGGSSGGNDSGAADTGARKDSGATDDVGGNGDSGGSDAGGGYTGPTVMITFEVVGTVLDGFVFCNTDASELGCATSDSSGSVTLEVPADSNIALTVDREDFVPLLYHYRTGSEDVTFSVGVPFLTEEQRAEHESVLGFDLQQGKGVVVAVAGGGLEGTATIDPKPENNRPYYWVLSVPDPERTTIGGGTAAWYDVEPGDYQVTFEVPGKDCRIGASSWPGDEPNAVKLRVMADRWSWNNVVWCTGEAQYTSVVDQYADAQACEDGMPQGAESVCRSCACDKCLDAINNCGAIAGCIDIVECAIEKDCKLDACYTPDTCQAVVDGTQGGFNGDATMAATAWGECQNTECDECGSD